MRNNETGEYELVVGNRQLLSGFFIVVLLCAVAFAMGYVVGENSHSPKPVETASGGAPKAVDTRPDAASPEPRETAPAPSTPASPPSEAAPDSKGAAADSAAADRPPQPTTKPARDVEQQPAPAPPKREPPPAPAPKAVPETVPGQYWQVLATANRNSAETLVQSLKDKGVPAALSPGPNNLTRVLVGPYTDTASLGRAKTDLESNGFTQLLRK
jgi:cell division septation protein DedD